MPFSIINSLFKFFLKKLLVNLELHIIVLLKYWIIFLDKKSPIINIPEAHHHIMVDQPLALVAALRSLIIDWDHSKPSKAQ